VLTSRCLSLYGYVLISYLYYHSYIIYLVTLILYEKRDKDMVMLSISICSIAYCSLFIILSTPSQW
jgi:hypothetical protein